MAVLMCGIGHPWLNGRKIQLQPTFIMGHHNSSAKLAANLAQVEKLTSL